MAKYKFTETAYVDGRLYHEGEVVILPASLVPGPHMCPLDDEARKAAKAVNMTKINPLDFLT